MTTPTEADVGAAVPTRLAELGCQFFQGSSIAPGTRNAGRTDYSEVVLE